MNQREVIEAIALMDCTHIKDKKPCLMCKNKVDWDIDRAIGIDTDLIVTTSIALDNARKIYGPHSTYRHPLSLKTAFTLLLDIVPEIRDRIKHGSHSAS